VTDILADSPSEVSFKQVQSAHDIFAEAMTQACHLSADEEPGRRVVT
jgi:hypothetical protein